MSKKWRKGRKGKKFSNNVIVTKLNDQGKLEVDTSVTKTDKFKFTPCYASHPVIELGGGEILGASCLHPVEGYDIYVGLDHGMQRTVYYPWQRKPRTAPVEVYFPITDMQAPSDVKNFKAMIDWLAKQLAKGKKVHVGCIGGHGRTGTLMAALIAQIDENPKSAEWIRKNYCESAIETTTQIDFLEKHYGIERVAGSKVYSTSYAGSQYYGSSGYAGYTSYGYQSGGYKSDKVRDTVTPLSTTAWNIWK